MTGRAWPSDGRGGTLNAGGTGPGSYYVLGYGVGLVGSRGFGDPDLLYRAVAYAVRAIQRRLDATLTPDGVFGVKTGAAARAFQTANKLVSDGAVGPKTAEALFAPTMAHLATPTVPECLLVGRTHAESGFDPGAVGYADSNDLGLKQINVHYHPDMTEEACFAPRLAILKSIDLHQAALDALDGNQRDAVAAYNLGIGGWSTTYGRLVGCKAWIDVGRPDWWTPVGSNTPRDVKGYIDASLSYCP